MEFWLSFNNGAEKFQLPINPEGYEVTRTSKNTIVNVIEQGDINLIGKVGLASYPLSSFFPREHNHYCKYTNIPKPEECIKLIEKWMNTGKPIRLRITDTEINTPVTIESFTYSKRDAFGNVKYTLDLLEYKFVSSNATDILDRQSKEPPKSYVIQEGDNLHIIAKKTTGNSSNWKSIASKNNIKNGAMREGQVLMIS